MPKMLNWMASCRLRLQTALILVLLLSTLALGVSPMQPAKAAMLPQFYRRVSALPAATSWFLVLPSDRVDEISVEKISQFIQAYLQVIQLLEQNQGALHHLDANGKPLAQPDIEQAALQLDIEQAALHKIEAAGLTRQEYLQLLNLANADPDFSDRIAMQLEDV